MLVWLSLTSLKRSDHAIETLIARYRYLDFSTLVVQIYKDNLALYLSFDVNKNVVATSYCCSVTCNQMTYLSELFEQDSRYESLSLVWLPLIEECENYDVSAFNEQFYFAIPQFDFCHQLIFISAIFLPESNQFIQWNLPKNIIRIGCPHGADIPLEDTLLKYGGALQFDYVLQATQMKARIQNYYPYIPSALVQHQSEEVKIVPFGVPKLDRLKHQIDQNKCDKLCIAYHLSNWKLETAFARSNIKKTVEALLKSFPEMDIIIRPFPADLHEPELMNQLAPFLQKNKVSISSNASYVEDYAKAALLITHRENTGQNFALASGRPIINFLNDQGGKVRESDLGYQVFSLKDLVNKTRDCLNKPSQEVERIVTFSNHYVQNLGQSIQYLSTIFDMILQRKADYTWGKLAVKADIEQYVNHENNITQCMINNVLAQKPFIQLAEVALLEYPKNSLFHYFTVLAYSNAPCPYQHSYYFLHWKKALEHFSSAVELCDMKDRGLIWKLHQWHSQFYETMLSGLLEQHIGQQRRCEPLLYIEILRRLKSEKFVIKRDKILQRTEAFPCTESDLISLVSISSLISDLPQGTTDVYLYAAGSIARDVIYIIEKFTQIRIIGVFDKDTNKQGEKIMGYSISSLNNDIKNKPIIICSFAYIDEIKKAIYTLLPEHLIVINVNKNNKLLSHE